MSTAHIEKTSRHQEQLVEELDELLRQFDEMREHAQRIEVMHETLVGAVREIAIDAGVNTREIEELGRPG